MSETMIRYDSLLSHRLDGLPMPNTAQFQRPAAPGVLNMSSGQPDPRTFPVDDLIAATDRVLHREADRALQYAGRQGYEGLRQEMVEHLWTRERLKVSADDMIITAGSSQALALICEVLLDPGDAVVVDGPTYSGAIDLFRAYHAHFLTVPLDAESTVVDEVERQIRETQASGRAVKFIYSLPNFQNPAGVTLSLARRQRLLEIAARYGVLIVEDDAYHDFRFEGEDIPSLYALDRNGLVIRCGTFSKILAAGLRLGWALGPKEIISRMMQMKHDGATCVFAAHVAAEYCRNTLENHVDMLVQHYKQKRDVLLEALDREVPAGTKISRPEGGFFLWLELPPGADPKKVAEGQKKYNVQWRPGTICYANGEGERFIRLAYSSLDLDELREAAKRIGQAIRDGLS